MHGARKRRSAVHLFTSGFHSRNCIRADMLRAVMHPASAVLSQRWSQQDNIQQTRRELLPAHSPNLNAFAERWVRSIKSECLAKLILEGAESDMDLTPITTQRSEC